MSLVISVSIRKHIKMIMYHFLHLWYNHQSVTLLTSIGMFGDNKGRVIVTRIQVASHLWIFCNKQILCKLVKDTLVTGRHTVWTLQDLHW